MNLTVFLHENSRSATIAHTHEVLCRIVVLSHGVEAHFLTMLPEVLIEVVGVAPCIPKAVAVVNEDRSLSCQHIVRVLREAFGLLFRGSSAVC